MFRSPTEWRALIGCNDRMERKEAWEMNCGQYAWADWLAGDNQFVLEDKRHFDAVIAPYTCIVGIYIKAKKLIS